MSFDVKFAFWWEMPYEDMPPQPFFDVNGSHLSLGTLQEKQVPIPDYPTLKDWKKEKK